MGISVTDKQVEEELAEIKKSSFPTKGRLRKIPQGIRLHRKT